MNRFNTLFHHRGRRALIPFMMLGDPDPDTSVELIRTLLDHGADALELGIPFSDPIADGPTVQRAAARALGAGCTVRQAMDVLRRVRALSEVPMGLLVYYNLIHRPGLDPFCRIAADHGVDALLAADLPAEESAAYEQALQQHGLGCVHLLAPNTSLPRARELLERSTAFGYVVSRFGTTGARHDLPPATLQQVQSLRAAGDRPLVVGFGISTANQVRLLHDHGADGVIAGSTLIQCIEQHPNDRPAMVRALGNRFNQLIALKEVSSCSS